MTQETLPTVSGTREFTGEYRSARAALVAAERLRNETPDVDVKIERIEKGPGVWTWKVTRVVQT